MPKTLIYAVNAGLVDSPAIFIFRVKDTTYLIPGTPPIDLGYKLSPLYSFNYRQDSRKSLDRAQPKLICVEAFYFFCLTMSTMFAMADTSCSESPETSVILPRSNPKR